MRHIAKLLKKSELKKIIFKLKRHNIIIIGEQHERMASRRPDW